MAPHIRALCLMRDGVRGREGEREIERERDGVRGRERLAHTKKQIERGRGSICESTSVAKFACTCIASPHSSELALAGASSL